MFFFGKVDVVKTLLLNTFCCSLYGSVIWNLKMFVLPRYAWLDVRASGESGVFLPTFIVNFTCDL